MTRELEYVGKRSGAAKDYYYFRMDDKDIFFGDTGHDPGVVYRMDQPEVSQLLSGGKCTAFATSLCAALEPVAHLLSYRGEPVVALGIAMANSNGRQWSMVFDQPLEVPLDQISAEDLDHLASAAHNILVLQTGSGMWHFVDPTAIQYGIRDVAVPGHFVAIYDADSSRGAEAMVDGIPDVPGRAVDWRFAHGQVFRLLSSRQMRQYLQNCNSVCSRVTLDIITRWAAMLGPVIDRK